MALINIAPILALSAFIFTYSFTQLTLFHFRKKIGYIPLYSFVSITIGFFNYFAMGKIMLDITDEIQFILFNTTLVVGVISTAFLLFLLDEPHHIRNFFYTIIIAEVFTWVYPALSYFFLTLDPAHVYLANPWVIDIFGVSALISFASTVALVCDIIFVIVFFHQVRKRLKNPIYAPIIGILAFIGALIIDAIVFPAIKSLFQLIDFETLFFRIPRFILSSFIYAIIILSYAHLTTKGEYFFYNANRSSLEILLGRTTIPIEMFLAEKRRAEILFDLMGHDMGNALQVYTTALQLLRDQFPHLEESTPLNTLKETFNRMNQINNIIKRLGNLYYINRYTIRTKKMVLPSICRNAISKAQKLYNEVEFNFIDKSDGDLTIKFNPFLEDAIFVILENGVIHNTSKNLAKKKINLLLKTMDRRRNQAIISITDNGNGIPNELKKILYEPLKNINIRTGLGFVTLKIATDFSNGYYKIQDFTIDSEKGTKIDIRIPILKQ